MTVAQYSAYAFSQPSLAGQSSVRAMGEEPIARLQAAIQLWSTITNCTDHHHQLHRSGASSFGNELVQSARLDESLTVGRPVLSADKRLASLKPLHLKATEADSVERGGAVMSQASRLICTLAWPRN